VQRYVFATAEKSELRLNDYKLNGIQGPYDSFGHQALYLVIKIASFYLKSDNSPQKTVIAY
jgi:hypothetical protein